MQRFVLVDHSVVSVGGHHLEYADHVLSTAADMGYEPILVSNRAATDVGGAGFRLHPIYRHGVWGFIAFPKLYGALKALERTFGRRGGARDALAATHDNNTTAGIWTNVKSSIMHFYDKRRRVTFAQDTVRLLDRLGVRTGDVFFLPTLGSVELHALLDVFSQRADAKHAQWHLLFRRDISVDSRSAAETRRMCQALARVRTTFADWPIHFYTDTEELSAAYAALDQVPFQTLPIPHTRPKRDSNTGRKNGLRIAYIGDARVEKGFHRLPVIVDALSRRAAGGERLRFVFQANYGTPNREQQVVAAQAALQRWIPDLVELITEPLTSEQYWDMLAASDIVLLPYEPQAYRARSSGIFVEALAVGRPVIVPAGTWMATQLSTIQGGSQSGTEPAQDEIGLIYNDVTEVPELLSHMIAHYATFRRHAEAFAPQWRARHNSLRLISMLSENTAGELQPGSAL